MTTLNLTLSDDLGQFVQQQARLAGMNGEAQYIETLISRAKQGAEHLELLLIAGLDSGEPARLDSDLRRSLRQQMKDALAE
jgi:hypothetical protein